MVVRACPSVSPTPSRSKYPWPLLLSFLLADTNGARNIGKIGDGDLGWYVKEWTATGPVLCLFAITMCKSNTNKMYHVLITIKRVGLWWRFWPKDMELPLSSYSPVGHHDVFWNSIGELSGISFWCISRNFPLWLYTGQMTNLHHFPNSWVWRGER